MTDVINFPKWKQNCTGIEKLREILQYAESKPEEVNHLFVIWENSDSCRQYATDSNLTIVQAIGMLELAKHDLLNDFDSGNND